MIDRFSLVSFLAVFAVTLAACSAGDDDDSNPGSGTGGSGGSGTGGSGGSGTGGSGTGGSGGSGTTLAGDWACNTTTTTNYASPPTGDSTKTKTSDTTVQAGAGSVTENFSGDFGFDCSIRFDVSGNTATIAAGQTCSGGGTTLTFTDGTLTLTDAQHMTRSYSYGISGTADGGAVVGAASAGSGCTRK
jgi:hypothetical protein